MKGFAIFAGNSNPALANRICDYLGVPLGKAQIKTFSDGEIQIEIQENVRLKDVFVIQSTSHPVNDHLMELLLMIDAFKRASCRRICAVIPYYGYARQDKKVSPRVPISAKLVANLLTLAGANRVISMDLHAPQIQGFFDIPVDHLFAAPVILEYIKNHFGRDLVVVSPDAGGAERARAYAKRLGCAMAVVDKRRDQPNVAHAMAVIGEVSGKTAVILDDMVDTAGTLTEAAGALADKGAREVYACCSHAVLSGPAIDRLEASPIRRIIVTDTIPLGERAVTTGRFEVLSIAGLMGEAIIRSYNGDSVTSLFV